MRRPGLASGLFYSPVASYTLGMKTWLLFLSLVFMVSLCGAQSSDVDGNQLFERCSAYLKARDNPPLTVKEQVDAGFCLGYMSAIADTNDRDVKAALEDHKAAERYFCAPSNATIEQLTRVVVKWIKENPEKMHYNAGVISEAALRAAFPCH
jgi:Ssp1 endopeptidase immunity protein Rap1a